jgi:hypothetical protein
MVSAAVNLCVLEIHAVNIAVRVLTTIVSWLVSVSSAAKEKLGRFCLLCL